MPPSPCGKKSAYGSFGPTSGHSFEATANLAKGAEPGKWTLVSISAYALLGNSVQLFFFNDTATTEIYTLSLHDALPIYTAPPHVGAVSAAPTSVDVTDAAASVKLI